MSVGSCEECSDIQAGVAIRSPGELTRAIETLRERLQSGFLVDITQPGHSPAGRFNELPHMAPWPDYIEHYFRCSACGRRFRLAVDTYRGTGGSLDGEVEAYQ